VRADIVDAVFRTTKKLGPEISMDDIAREAIAGKPKLYRHFSGKTDLYNAVLDHVTETLWTQIVGRADLAQDSVSQIIQHGVAEYLDMLTEEPNLFIWLTQSGIAKQAAPDGHAIAGIRQIAQRLDIALHDAGGRQVIEPRIVELLAFSILGMAAAATDWWLSAEHSATPPMTPGDFATYLSRAIETIVGRGISLHGITIDPARPFI